MTYCAKHGRHLACQISPILKSCSKNIFLISIPSQNILNALTKLTYAAENRISYRAVIIEVHCHFCASVVLVGCYLQTQAKLLKTLYQQIDAVVLCSYIFSATKFKE